MKTMMTAALALSLLGGTSALAQTDHDRQASRQESRAQKAEARQDRREDKAEARQERRKEQPAAVVAERPVAEQRERIQDKREQVQDRREQVQERRGDLQEQRVRLQQRAAQGQDVREQRERLQERRERVQDQSQRVHEQRERLQDQRQRLQDRTRQHNNNLDWMRNYRPGTGHQLRDRDHNRSWYDASRWQRTYRATHRYRAPTYRYPSGWYVRTWAFGDIMPRGWYSQPYYLDWRQYGLPRPPVGTEWVRQRDDALLVDVWNGRVLAVYYDLFW